jgi:hypothetical protein
VLIVKASPFIGYSNELYEAKEKHESCTKQSLTTPADFTRDPSNSLKADHVKTVA